MLELYPTVDSYEYIDRTTQKVVFRWPVPYHQHTFTVDIIDFLPYVRNENVPLCIEMRIGWQWVAEYSRAWCERIALTEDDFQFPSNAEN